MSESKVLKIKASDESMQAVNDFVHSMLPANCDLMLLNQIDLAVEEIFVNIAHYSGAAEAEIICDFKVAGDGSGVLSVIFKDGGKPFNPLERADPDLSLSAEERSIGGLGIFLTKKFMDSVEYEFVDGKNCLTITKRIASC
jgi:anti-sigma regulatory factor (Ser/Thr protein kinase)